MKPRRLCQAIDTLYCHGAATSESYTRLLLDCLRSNDVEQARRIQTHMDIHLYKPTDTFLHNKLLHIYAKSGKISDAQNLFDKMPKRDVYSWNAMLSVYSKLNLVDDLWSLFDLMPCRDSVSYNTMISCLAGNGCSGMAFELFVRMRDESVEVTEYTFVSLLQACWKVLDLKRGKQIHGRLVVHCGGDLGGNVFVANALTDMYAKCGSIDFAKWLFDRMGNKNLVTWNSMISGYLKRGQVEKCIELFEEMKLLGFRPDQITISNVVGALFRCEKIDEAIKIFDEIKDKDKISWTTMIVCLSRYGKEEDALILFGNMLSANVRPDKFTISIVVSSCAKLASLTNGKVVHGRAVNIGVDNDLLVSSALIDMYSKCGETKDAWLVFKMMPNRNVISWNSMIIGYAQNGQDLEALSLYEKMFKEPLKPDDVTFVGVLSACVHSISVDYGEKCFYSISEQHGKTPTLDHYACMISLYGRSGNMDKALGLIMSMPHKPNCLIWSTLLSVCATNSDVENGEIAAKNLIELDPHDASPYIMLSNVYAGCKRWNDVASIRSLMKSNSVKKFAAYSWVEIGNKVYKFVAEDRTHPETDKIYEELNKLIRQLLKAGFTPNPNLVLQDVGEDEKFESICYHSEKLALAFWLLKKPYGEAPIRIMKNIRVCSDCHVFMNFASNIVGRSIILRDSKRFHHFSGGKCSCNDQW